MLGTRSSRTLSQGGGMRLCFAFSAFAGEKSWEQYILLAPSPDGVKDLESLKLPLKSFSHLN